MTTQSQYETIKFLFDYFKRLKQIRFCKTPESAQTPFSSLNPNICTADFSNVLKDCNFTPDEQAVIIYYGQIFKTPKVNAQTRWFWDSAIQKLEQKLTERNFIKE